MEKFFKFLDDMGISKEMKYEFEVLLLGDDDLKHFEDKIFSPDKSFDVMVYEMRKYKVLKKPMPIEVYKMRSLINEFATVSELLGQYISDHDWCEIKAIMKIRNMSLLDIYHKHKEQVDRNTICNIWQLIL